MSQSKSFLLVVECSHVVHLDFQQSFREYHILEAWDCETAKEHFHQHKDEMVAVVVSACLFNDQPNTLELIRWMKTQGFSPVLGMSEDPAFLPDLTDAGADYSVRKEDAIKMLRQVLQGSS